MPALIGKSMKKWLFGYRMDINSEAQYLVLSESSPCNSPTPILISRYKMKEQ